MVWAPWASLTQPPASWMSRLAAAAAQAGSPQEVADAGATGYVCRAAFFCAHFYIAVFLLFVPFHPSEDRLSSMPAILLT